MDFELCCVDGEVKSHDSMEGAWVSWFLFPFAHPPATRQALVDNGFAESCWGRMGEQSKLGVPPDQDVLQEKPATAGLKLGLFSYPVLQAADILIHKFAHL